LAYVLAVASAVLYGAADFLGGLASKRASAIVVVLASQCAGLVLLVAMLPLLPAATASSRDFVWGGAAGLAGGIAVGLLYRALAIGRMAVVAPTTAVCAVVIPVAAAVLFGERPPLRALAGIAVAIAAIVLVAQHDSPAAPSAAGGRAGPAGFGLALISGVLIGLFFLALARTGATAGLWPLVSARAVSVVLFAVFALATRRSVVAGRATTLLMVAAGATDMLANALYLLATRFGPLSGVVTLASLYPASTITLARVVLGERLTTRQAVGIVCAIVAVVLIVG
jgi:uncharacterized membrane protein